MPKYSTDWKPVNRRRNAGVAVLAAAAIAISVFGASATAVGVSLGSRYCSYGQDAFTAASSSGPNGQAYTIIHQQTSNGVTRMSGLPTYGNQIRSWTAGWQSFSSSSVSDYTDTRYTFCG
jgi:hypothetical protein